MSLKGKRDHETKNKERKEGYRQTATLVTVINLDAHINLDSKINWSILNNVLSQKYDYLYKLLYTVSNVHFKALLRKADNIPPISTCA